MDIETWAYIRRLFFVDKIPKKRIARQLGIDVKTVRRAIAKEKFIEDSKGSKGGSFSKLEPFKKDITELVERYPDITAVRVFEELKDRGYEGGISILRDYLYTHRVKQKKAFLRVETLPGEQAQVDWTSCGKIKVDGHERRLSCFVMVLSFSRLMYLEFTLSQRIEDFMSCHLNAFRFYGGVPKKVLYDNLKSVVLARFGKDIKFNPRFIDFSGYYLFQPILCNVGAGHEKGKVESGIKYVKGNFLSCREFKDFMDLKIQAVEWRDRVANSRIHGTTRRKPIELYELEKKKLQSLPLRDYDTSVVRGVKSTPNCYVKFDSNMYSVPFKYASQNLVLRATIELVKIYAGEKLIATHLRCFEKYQVIENPSHCEGLIEMRGRARGVKLREAFSSLGEEAKQYLSGLVHSELDIDHHVGKIMGLVRLYGKRSVLSAITHALQYKAFSYEYVKNILYQNRKRMGLKEVVGVVTSKERPEIMELTVEERDLSLYDKLFKEEEND